MDNTEIAILASTYEQNLIPLILNKSPPILIIHNENPDDILHNKEYKAMEQLKKCIEIFAVEEKLTKIIQTKKKAWETPYGP